MKLNKKETEELNVYLQKLLDDRIAQCKRLEGEIDALKAKASEVVAELREMADSGEDDSEIAGLLHAMFTRAADLVASKLGVKS